MSPSCCEWVGSLGSRSPSRSRVERIVAVLAASIVVGCGSRVPKPEVEELVAETGEIADGAGAGKKAKSKGDRNPYENKDPKAADNSASTCGAKVFREDCTECCAANGGDECVDKAACGEKPPADDCRVNGCAADLGESCTKCHVEWRCLASGWKC